MDSRRLSRFFTTLGLLLLMMMTSGCSREEKKINWPQVELQGSRDEVILKTSYIISIKGHEVGYALLDAKHDATQDEVYGIWFMTLKFKRGMETTESLQDVHFVETPDGVLTSIEVDSSDSGTKMATVSVDGETLEVQSESSGKRASFQKPWTKGALGPLAIDLSLVRKMMKPGETRTFSNVEPSTLTVYKQTLTAHDYEEVDGFDDQSLLKISVLSEADGISMNGELWVNSEGITMRATYPQMGMEFRWVEKRTEATAVPLRSSSSDVDLQEVTSVEIQGVYEQEAVAQNYILTSSLTDLSGVFDNSQHQVVKKRSKDEVVLHTSDRSIQEESAPEVAAERYLAGSSLIQTEHQGIRAKAEELVSALESDSDKVAALHEFVYQHMEEKNYSQAMTSAGEAFESREGDCTEHACLFAAMARTAGLPTRLVSGLVAVPDGGLTRCYFHMWNEVLVDGHWLPVDATRQASETKWSRYIKVADASQAEEDNQQWMMSSVVLLGDLSIFSK